ncbi:family 43 glycosylhydrolase [Streptomyces shenzhenensis]|uniref:Glycoside hydrolase n=1 Tax=Streptomyces shenzhenensis TaxID=943815 RepID=A0A3M0I5J1_9ACTN|nr:family 43 glycosylhydrolase [Streptomyces shenzhenensis]RMB81389.1 hypothetical protein CTZ28_34755 [Streptomyces shenzhenensis]
MSDLPDSGGRVKCRLVKVTALALGLAAIAGIGTAAAQPPSFLPSAASAVDPADESKDFPFPDPDTIALQNGSGRYITYGTSSGGKYIPYAVHGSGGSVGTSPVIAGDALRGGGGAWVDNSKGIWAPGAFHHVKNGVGRYYLFYAGLRKGTSQRCIGVASSTSPFAGFRAQPTPLACPTNNDWAIDPDVTRGPNGAVWMTWRDGQRAHPGESALSVMMLRFRNDGTVQRNSTPHVMLRSDNLAWPRYQVGRNKSVIENPSAVFLRGNWYLFYSGNRWQTNNYATGIAFCGKKIDTATCGPMPGPRRAWFSYSGPGPHLPSDMRMRALPGNKRGPGAMSVYFAHNGQPWATWHYLTGSGRKSRTGKLHIVGTGSTADFRITSS